MALLSRWSGGLLDRFGARWPLVVGPSIAALGFGLLAVPIDGGSYWEFLVPITILGLGLVISVAPLTTVVLGAVPAHQTGVAAGINTAVASVASFFGIALLGALALGIYDQALNKAPPCGVRPGAAGHPHRPRAIRRRSGAVSASRR